MSQPMMVLASAHGGPLFSMMGLEVNSVTTTTWGIMAVLVLVCILATRKLEIVPVRKSQIAVELAVDTLITFLGSIMGGEEKAKKYFPLLGSLFFIILISNYSGLLPGFGHTPGLQAPTSALSFTAALALVVFFTTHIQGVKSKGLAYFKHFVSPHWAMLPMNLMEELVKPISLALRLYGNIFGEETLVASIFAMAPMFVPLPFMFLGVFFGFIQALVFTLLTATYLASATAEAH